MNRETKIGLLVGLAFVIVIGILISDHLSSANEQAGAPLQLAGTSLRSGLGDPGGDDIAPMLRIPQSIAPMQRIPTHEEAVSHNAGEPGVVLVNPQPQTTPQNNGDTIAQRIRKEAIARGEDVVPFHGNNDVTPPVIDPQNPTEPEKPALAATYKAQSGDTLGTIALRAYGSNNRANREAIVAANPGLKANRDLIVEGRSYIIPSAAGSKAAPVAQATPVVNETVPAPEATDNWYVVQQGDSLWSIAMQEVGSPSAVATIEDLNQDALNGSDHVRPNMKLRLPPKKLAAAN